MEIWSTASLHMYCYYTLLKTLDRYLIDIAKSLKSINNKNYIKYCEIHYLKYNLLFDICPYRCKVKSDGFLNCHWYRYPSHTKSVERHIRLVSKASESISNLQDRDGHINVTLIERQLMPYFKSKKDFIK